VPMSATVASARQDWEEGYRRFQEQARDPARAHLLYEQLEAITGELRRRIGGAFTLAELAAAYAGAERWSRVAVADRAPAPGWARTLAVVEDSAFHLYSRGAVDFEP
jgi:ferric-dicitrate binding protein FerR (iron transport regulator)